MKKMILILASLFVILGASFAKDAKTKVSQELTRVVNKYSSARYLSFDITYRYAREEQPALYLDSLKGRFKMNGRDYWCQLDSTESMCIQDLSVFVFKEDQIIYLSRPSASMGTMNPVSLLDSFLVHNQDIEFSLTEAKKQKNIRLQFPEGDAYRAVEYTINKRTGFIEKVLCTVRASQLYDPSVRSMVEGDTYAVIEISIDNYRTGGFDDAQFSTERYFKKEGRSYVAVAPYETYRIFLGSAQL